MKTTLFAQWHTLDRQIPLPFTLSVSGKTFTAQAILRLLPGRRLVCRGVWGGKSVVAKCFFHAKHAARDFTREQTGLLALQQAGVLVPALYVAEYLPKENVHVLLLEDLQPAESLKTLLTKPANSIQLQALLSALTALHQSGFVYDDAHLDNFLWQNGQLFVVDGGGVVPITPGLPVRRKIALKNIGALLAQFYPHQDAGCLQAWQQMSQASDTEKKQLKKAIADFRKWRMQDFSKKLWRDCSLFAVQKKSSFHFVAARDMLPWLTEWRQHPDKIAADKIPLKLGNSSTVEQITFNDQTWVQKRYNLKNLQHALSRGWRKTRAEISWHNAWKLWFLGVPTAKPKALWVERAGPWRKRGFLLMEKIQGVPADQYFQQQIIGQDEVVQQMAGLLKRLDDLCVSHGDLKASNWLITAEGPVLLDLDALTWHRFRLRQRRAFAKDMQRFLANWQHDGVLQEKFKQELTKVFS